MIEEIIVEEKDIHRRLDQLLVLKMNTSRNQVQHLIRNGNILINGQIQSKINYKIKLNDTIEYKKPNLHNSNNDNDYKLDIVYEDNDLFVINKPSGLVVHSGVGNKTGTLTEILLNNNRILSSLGDSNRPGIVHRLDKDTSGLMIIAKNNEAHAAISEQIRNHEIKRTYYTIVFGKPNTNCVFGIKSAQNMHNFQIRKYYQDANYPYPKILDKSLNEYKKVITYITRSHSDHRKMSVHLHVKYNLFGDYNKASEHKINNARLAVTYYQVIKKLCKNHLSLVKVRLGTGRTHQIRVHMSYIGHSILGDQFYGNNAAKVDRIFKNTDIDLTYIQSQALHSHELEFEHFRSKNKISLVSELSEDIQKMLKLES